MDAARTSGPGMLARRVPAVFLISRLYSVLRSLAFAFSLSASGRNPQTRFFAWQGGSKGTQHQNATYGTRGVEVPVCLLVFVYLT